MVVVEWTAFLAESCPYATLQGSCPPLGAPCSSRDDSSPLSCCSLLIAIGTQKLWSALHLPNYVRRASCGAASAWNEPSYCQRHSYSYLFENANVCACSKTQPGDYLISECSR